MFFEFLIELIEEHEEMRDNNKVLRYGQINQSFRSQRRAWVSLERPKKTVAI